MKITKQQFKAALTVAYEAGFDGGRVLQHSPTDTVKRIAKHEVKHARARKHWNVNNTTQRLAAQETLIQKTRELVASLAPTTSDDLLADFNFDEEQDNEG